MGGRRERGADRLALQVGDRVDPGVIARTDASLLPATSSTNATLYGMFSVRSKPRATGLYPERTEVQTPWR